MEFPKAWRWTEIICVPLLVVVSIWVEEPRLRALFAVLAISPLIFITTRMALRFESRFKQTRRKYTRLRDATDDFIIAVRNLNRITVLAQEDETPATAEEMAQEVTQRLHGLVDKIVEAAGKEDPYSEGGPSEA